MSEKLVTDNEKICRAEEGELEFETPWGGHFRKGKWNFQNHLGGDQTPNDTMDLVQLRVRDFDIH